MSMSEYTFKMEVSREKLTDNSLFIFNEGGKLLESHTGSGSFLASKVKRFMQQASADIALPKTYETWMLPKYVQRYFGTPKITMVKRKDGSFLFIGEALRKRMVQVRNHNGTAASARRELCNIIKEEKDSK